MIDKVSSSLFFNLYIYFSLYIYIYFYLFLHYISWCLPVHPGGWGVKGKIWSQWLLWTWFNSWRPSLACRQLRLPDSRWSRILTQFLDANLVISSHEICNLHPRVIKQNVDDAFFFKVINMLNLIQQASLKGFIMDFTYRGILQYVIKNNLQNCGF